MNTLLKYLGAFILLVGVAILAIFYLIGGMSNTILAIGLTVMIIGYFGHIIINKRLAE